MALVHSPRIVTNGLTFFFDQNNVKSYKGPAMQNLANNISILGTGGAAGYSSSGSTEVVDIPGLGSTTTYVNTIQNNYLSFSPNSNNCCPSLHGWGGIAVSPSTLYTYGIVYKVDSGYTNPNFMYRYEYTSSSGTYVTEGGVHSDVNRVHLGGGWYYAWATFTTQATTNWISHAGLFYYRYSQTSDRVSVAKTMIVQGDYSGLHPKYWPAQATTRSNTQVVVDLTGRSTATVNNLTYNNDGTFEFNYANSSGINIPLSTSFNKVAGTMNFWVYPTRYNGANGYFVNREDGTANAPDWFWIGPYGDSFYFRIGNGTDCCSNDLSFPNLQSIVPLNTWINLCFTWQGNGTANVYKNGVLYSSRNIGNIPLTNPSSNGTIGLGHANADTYFHGKMPVVQIYGRQLSASEVLQNFQAMKGRFGL